MGNKAEHKRKSAAPSEQAAGWITLTAAHELVTDFMLAPKLAEQEIREGLETGQIRWRCWRLEGLKIKGTPDPKPGDPAFWKSLPRRTEGRQGVIQIIDPMTINWAESWAKQRGVIGCIAYRVEVAHADVLTLLQLPVDEKDHLSPQRKRPKGKPLLAVGRELWPNSDGWPPNDLSDADLVEQAGDAFEKKHKPRTVGRLTILRTFGRIPR